MILFYLLKVTTCTILFFGFYALVLQKLTFFKINRFYLLVTLLLSFVIPALQFEIKYEVVTVDTDPVANLSAVKTTEKPSQPIQPLAVGHQPEINSKVDWLGLVPYAYGTITLILMLICLWRLFGLIKHTRSYTESVEGLKLISKSVGFTNCSFFNYVFIDGDKLGDADLAVLLKHELVHARQYHSMDKIILMVFKSVLWFNPIVYLYDKALEQVHEYEADEITSAAYGSEAYASLLLKLAIAKSDMPLIHNFVKSPIKARIKMLFSSKSPSKKKNTYLLMLPAVLVLLWVFAVKSVYADRQTPDENKSQKGFIKPGQSLLDDTINVAKDLRARYADNVRKGDEMLGKQLNVKFLGFRESKNGVLGDISYHNKIYLFEAIINLGKLSTVKIGDSLKIEINGFSVQEPYTEMTLWVNKISTSKGHVLYEGSLKKPPFLCGMDGLRFTFSRIAAIDQDANHIKRITLKHNNYRIILDVAEENFSGSSLQIGDEISVEFTGEKLISTDTYFSNQIVELHSRQNKYAFKAKTLYAKYHRSADTIRGITTSIKKIGSPVKPRIISFSKITGDIKKKVSFMENAVIDIVDCRLNAKYVQLDEPNNKMIAKNAVLKAKTGNSLTASVIVFDLKMGNFKATSDNGKAADPKKPGLERQLKNALLAQPFNEADAKVEYRAKDSVKMSRDKSIIYLFGDAMVIYNGIKLNGSKITYNKMNNTISANGATVSSNKIDRLIKADSIYLNLKTSKATLFGENF
jgi:lipopolysaccharide export system protein LptA